MLLSVPSVIIAMEEEAVGSDVVIDGFNDLPGEGGGIGMALLGDDNLASLRERYGDRVGTKAAVFRRNNPQMNQVKKRTRAGDQMVVFLGQMAEEAHIHNALMREDMDQAAADLAQTRATGQKRFQITTAISVPGLILSVIAVIKAFAS